MLKMRICLAILVYIVISMLLPNSAVAISSGIAIDSRPNIIVIMTDDQRWDTIDYMPNVKNRLEGEGITFTNSFVTTSLCCPSRSSFLTGLYPHNTGVWSNGPIYGGVLEFNETSTLATWLKENGYTTSLNGKYLNGYARIPRHIPPGWDDWHVFTTGDSDLLLSLYYNYTLNENGVLRTFGKEPIDYSTDVLKNRSLNFIQNAKRPFFLWFTPFAPHSPYIAAERHINISTCSNLKIVRPPSFNEADVSDKPAWVQANPLMNQSQISRLDVAMKNQICSLQAVDEAVASILDALGPELDNTAVIFTSDNGYMWGEHRIDQDKNNFYEEASRVPLLIRYPKLIPNKTQSDKLVLNIDLAPTIAELANVTLSAKVDGKSLVAILNDQNASWRSDFLMEYMGGRIDRPLINSATRTMQFKYTELATGEREFYDLTNDPYELNNQINNSTYTNIIFQLELRLMELKPKKINLVQNPSFEENTFKCGIQPSKWNGFQCNLNFGYGQTNDSHSGDIAIKILNSPNSSGPWPWQEVNVTSGKYYNYKLFAKSDNSTITTMLTLLNNSVEQPFRKCVFNQVSNSWKEYTCTFKAPTNLIRIRFFQTAPNTTIGKTIIDDLTLSEISQN